MNYATFILTVFATLTVTTIVGMYIIDFIIWNRKAKRLEEARKYYWQAICLNNK